MTTYQRTNFGNRIRPIVRRVRELLLDVVIFVAGH